MRRLRASWIVSVGLGFIVGAGIACNAPVAKTQAPLSKADQVGINPITKVTPGMTLLDALRELSPPTSIKGNTYYYKDLGRLVFEGTASPTDKTKVVKVEPDKMEDGIAPQP
jgi:hypothetical protein